MPIPTNTSFDAKNQELTKRPLYIVVIENVVEWLTTFRPEDQAVELTGYGIGGYGINNYGY
jgi:hypothetical protein